MCDFYLRQSGVAFGNALILSVVAKSDFFYLFYTFDTLLLKE